MNKLTIIGELTSNPKGRVLCTKGPACAVCDFTVAARNAPQETQYFRVSCRGAQAERCMKHLHKGSTVAATGSVSARAYQTPAGEIRASLDVRPEEIEIINVKEDATP